MQRDFRRHPEIAEQPINGPVIVMGTARSGTTKLQKVLAASGDFNFLTFWQAFNWASISGEPNEPTAERIAEAEAFCRWFDERSPETKLGHSFEALEPEEEGVLTEASFVTPTFVGFAEVPGYGRWLGEQPPTIELEFLRDALKYLQWQGLASADRPWLLKSPSYSSLELEILQVFPDARFVMAHRSPLRTLPSMCTLVAHFRRAYGTSTPDPRVLFEHAASSMDAQQAIRRAHPDLPLLDVLVRGHRRRPPERGGAGLRPRGHDPDRSGARQHAAVGRRERHAQVRRVHVLARRRRPRRAGDPGADERLLRLLDQLAVRAPDGAATGRAGAAIS